MTGQTSLDELLEAVAEHDAGFVPMYLRAVDSLAPGVRFTTAGLADMVGLVDPPTTAVWGAATAAARKAGLAVRVGYTTSPRPTTRHSAVAEWQRTSKRLVA